LNHDGRALTEKELEAIQKNIFQGCYHDAELLRLFETIAVQRKVLHDVLTLFKSESFRLVSTADPIRNSTLAHFKELVSMEDIRS
jgi:hypothetical protein